MTEPAWVCAQQGAREHYAIPRALHRRGALRRLLTDLWVPAGRWPGRLPGRLLTRLAGRSHPDLPRRVVRAFTGRFLAADLEARLRGGAESARYAARNELFDRLATAALSRELRAGPPPVLFAYAHACRRLFARGRAGGCRTVLGQIDPGPAEADIVDAEAAAHPEVVTTWRRYPGWYVDRWWEEVEAADVVLVNSNWSADCLTRAGVPADRLRVVPLVYTPPARGLPARRYPSAFTPARPLVVLFLGQVILRKGVARLVKAARLLAGEPVRFVLVGPTDITNLADLIRGLPVQWEGSVPRGEVERHYAAADVFLLPTLSDGFALTQLEALAWRLPVIATDRCGRVVQDGRNGLLLPEPSAGAIAAAVRRLLTESGLAAELSAGTRVSDYSLVRLADDLAALAPARGAR